MTTRRERLSRLRDGWDREMAELALKFFPTAERETEAQRMERERAEADRTARMLAMRDTRDAVLGGVYGKDAKAKAADHAARHGKDSEATLQYCSRLADRVRKSAHYRLIAIQKKDIP